MTQEAGVFLETKHCIAWRRLRGLDPRAGWQTFFGRNGVDTPYFVVIENTLSHLPDASGVSALLFIDPVTPARLRSGLCYFRTSATANEHRSTVSLH